jgi:TIGR00251 family protein
MTWFHRDSEGSLVLRIHAQPGAKRTEVAGLHGDALKIRVKAPALEDRANEALAEFIAERLGVARRDVTLVSGARSREKRFAVRGAEVDPARLFSP